MLQILQGIVYIHSKGLALNQLNPYHILHVNPGNNTAVKIIDFDEMGKDNPIEDMEKFLGNNKREFAAFIAPE